MRINVEIADEYTSQSGFRDSRVFEKGGPIYSTVDAGPHRAAELVQAAMLAMSGLGDLMRYITEVELSFEKPALLTAIWPRFCVTVSIPGTELDWKIRGPAAGMPACDVRSDGPFPTDQFAGHMIETIRRDIERQLEKIRGQLKQVEDSIHAALEAAIGA